MPKKVPVTSASVIPSPIKPKSTDTSRPDLQRVNKPKTLHGKFSLLSKGGGVVSKKRKEHHA